MIRCFFLTQSRIPNVPSAKTNRPGTKHQRKKHAFAENIISCAPGLLVLALGYGLQDGWLDWVCERVNYCQHSLIALYDICRYFASVLSDGSFFFVKSALRGQTIFFFVYISFFPPTAVKFKIWTLSHGQKSTSSFCCS